MKKLTIDIGTIIDIEDLIESRMLIQANSGGGKSGIARVMMEQSFGKIPYIVLDKKGEYYTLKEKHPDIIVIGGINGDIPISMQAAATLARFIITHRLTVIIDMSSLEDDNVRANFIAAFLKGMMNLGQQLWIQYLVFIEEAHIFCGQQERTTSAKYIKLLMSEGRKMGYCGILLTQRISKLHKDAAAECNNKFIGRTFLDIDINRSASEMGLAGKDKNQLRELKPRHFWAFGTSIDPHHVHEVVIRNAETKFPKAGTKIDLAAIKPTDKIKAALAKLNELPAEAAKELNTIVELKKELQRVTTELSKANRGKNNLSAPVDISQNETVKSLKAEIDELKRKVNAGNKLIVLYKKAVLSYERRNLDISEKVKKIVDTLTNTHGIEIPETFDGLGMYVNNASAIPKQNVFIRPAPQGLSNTVSLPTGNGSLGKCSREVIRFLAQYPVKLFSKAQVAIATGYSINSGGFNNALSELNQRGFIIRDGKLRVNEDAMQEIVDSVGEISHQDYNIETFKNNLQKCEREIYEVLLQNPDQSFSKQQLSQTTQTSYSPDSGGFNNALSRLNTLELIHRSNGQIKLNPELLDLM